MADDVFIDGFDAVAPSPHETTELLQRVRSGDDVALSALLAKFVPRLTRWAAGRLPDTGRSIVDTGHLVQRIATNAVKQLADRDGQEHRAVGFYLRQAVLNEIAARQRNQDAGSPRETTVAGTPAEYDPSPLDRLLGVERVSLYENALSGLTTADREAIIGRFELAYGYEELARYLGEPSAAAARIAVIGAVRRLALKAASLSTKSSTSADLNPDCTTS